MTGAKREWKLSMWLLLVTIFAHALLPAGSALARTPGSAFSATTADVSLAPARKVLVAKSRHAQRAPEPPGDGLGDALTIAVAPLFLPPLRIAAAAGDHSARFDPPSSSVETGPFEARAPPLS